MTDDIGRTWGREPDPDDDAIAQVARTITLQELPPEAIPVTVKVGHIAAEVGAVMPGPDVLTSLASLLRSVADQYEAAAADGEGGGD